jgi:hypothetical protein
LDYAKEAQQRTEMAEGPLDAYLMAKGIIERNQMLARGEEPLDAQGYPLCSQIISDVGAQVIQCYGRDPAITAAIAAAELITTVE